MLGLVCSLLALGQVTTQKGSIEGVVTNSVTGDPVPRAIVRLSPMKAPGGRYKPTLSDASGKFVFADLEVGDYQLHAQRSGYAPQYATWSERPGADDHRLTVRSGQRKDDVVVRLVPNGSLSGRVLDSNGDPMPDAQVRAEGPRGGGSGQTDEQGRFRVGGLAPGAYVVHATALEMPIPPEIRTDGTTEIHHDPTYFPSVLKEPLASRVKVAPASETQGVEIRMLRGPIVRVSGRVKGVPAGTSGLMLNVTQQAGGNLSNSGMVAPDGSFALWRVAPGVHYLSVKGTAPEGQWIHTAPVRVTVAGTNVDNIELFAVPPFDVSGRVEFESGSAPRVPRTDPRRLQVVLEMAGD